MARAEFTMTGAGLAMGDVVPIQDGKEPQSQGEEAKSSQAQGSVTRWLVAFRAGRTSDGRLVWERYFARLAGHPPRI
jgi:hypothetical protein